MPKITTREKIVSAADMLFYQRGFDHTSFADIATEVGISRGNFYYHFTTKDEILDAVIARRIADRQQMLKDWEDTADAPVARIKAFIDILIRNQEKIMRYGCPVGTLSTELEKLNHPAALNAHGIFTLFRRWLARQFEALGREEDADALAMHVLTISQGVATLANAFRDEAFVTREVQKLRDWVDALDPNSTLN